MSVIWSQNEGPWSRSSSSFLLCLTWSSKRSLNFSIRRKPCRCVRHATSPRDNTLSQRAATFGVGQMGHEFASFWPCVCRQRNFLGHWRGTGASDVYGTSGCCLVGACRSSSTCGHTIAEESNIASVRRLRRLSNITGCCQNTTFVCNRNVLLGDPSLWMCFLTDGLLLI